MDKITDAAMPPGFDLRTSMVPPPWLLPWGPWLHMTRSAFDAWMGLWTAVLPQHQAEFVLQVQRQALEAWTAPLALAAPPPEPQAQPARHPPLPAVAAARPAEAPQPETMVPAAPAPHMPFPEMPGPDSSAPEKSEPDGQETVSAQSVSTARPVRLPQRPSTATKPDAASRQPRAHKASAHPRNPRPKTRR